MADSLRAPKYGDTPRPDPNDDKPFDVVRTKPQPTLPTK